MPEIGSEEKLHFPAGLFILAVSRYLQTESLITSYKTADIIHQPRFERRRRRKFNKRNRGKRINVEHMIKDIETFGWISSLYRHPRWEMVCIVELFSALAKRRIDKHYRL